MTKPKNTSKKTPFGMRKTKSVKSPTGKPSKKSSAAKKAERGDYSGGKRPPKKKIKRKPKVQKGTIPKLEQALRDAGA